MLDKIIKLIRDNNYLSYATDEQLRGMLQKHIEYKTLVTVWDNDDIVAIARFNLSEGNKKAYILDALVKPEYRQRGIIKRILKRGLDAWQDIEELEWDRPAKNNKKFKIKVKRKD